MSKIFLFSVGKNDFKIQTFTAGGPGGQHQNRVETGVRIIHPASGAVGESRSEKSQHRNKKLALHHLAASTKFTTWVRIKASQMRTGQTIDQIVEKAMAPENIKVEVHDDKGRWIEVVT
jgi:protein subunit release factor B